MYFVSVDKSSGKDKTAIALFSINPQTGLTLIEIFYDSQKTKTTAEEKLNQYLDTYLKDSPVPILLSPPFPDFSHKP